MSAIPTFDPCKHWLGVDAVDLVSPHRVLGIAPSVTDPVAIVQAADRRLAVLREVDPGPFGRARDALVARVCEARDGLLQSGRAVGPPAGIAPPPVPPPVPSPVPAPVPAVPASAIEPEPAAAEPDFGVVPFAPRPVRQPIRRGSRDTGPALVSLALLLVAAGALAAYVFRPELFAGLRPRQIASRPEASQRPPVDESGATAPAETDPAVPAPPADAATRPEEEEPPRPVKPTRKPREPRPVMPADERPPPPEDASPPPTTPTTPATETPDPETRAAALARVDERLAAAYAALREEDFEVAHDALAAAAGAATEAEDQEAVDRVGRWKLLARYAERFPGYREQAFAAAKAGREYDVKGTVIAVIEVNDEVFVYRVQGQNRRVPRDKIPEVVSLAIVSEWFAGDGRAANHIFLGVHHLARPQPDPVAAADEFRTAARGGEDVASLEALLDDPLVTAAAGDQ